MYLGRSRPTETTSSVLRSTYTGNGSTTTYALPGPVANETSIIATINGVTQQDAAYSTDGSNIIFVAAPALGDSIEIRTLSAVAMSYAPSAGSVVTGTIADGAVTSGKLATGASVANIGARAITNAQVPAGSVLQVVSSTLSGSFQTAATSLTATGLIATITPTSASSKLFVIYNLGNTHKSGGAPVNMFQYFSLYRQISGGGYSQVRYGGYQGGMSNGSAGGDVFGGSMVLTYLDSPATTGTVNYQIYMSGDNASYYVYMGEGSTTCTITVMEIAQ